MSWKKAVVVGATTAVLGLGYWASQAVYNVKEVIDGDTFITSEDRYVRLDSVNAPEIEDCLGKEAKEELEKLVLKKKVFIKTTYVDGHKRLVSSVYTIKGNVGEILLSKGLATFLDKGTQKGTTLSRTAKDARDKGIGVYSSICTQSTNLSNPKCNIKGNITNLGKLYRYPGCGQYNNTLVQLYLGEKWFCSEKDAKKEGFIKGSDCK